MTPATTAVEPDVLGGRAARSQRLAAVISALFILGALALIVLAAIGGESNSGLPGGTLVAAGHRAAPFVELPGCKANRHHKCVVATPVAGTAASAAPVTKK